MTRTPRHVRFSPTPKMRSATAIGTRSSGTRTFDFTNIRRPKRLLDLGEGEGNLPTHEGVEKHDEMEDLVYLDNHPTPS